MNPPKLAKHRRYVDVVLPIAMQQAGMLELESSTEQTWGQGCT